MRAPTSTRPIPCTATSFPRATSSVATAGPARRTQLHKTALPKDVAVNTLMIERQAFNRTIEQFRKVNRIENCFREARTCWFVIPEDASHGLRLIEIVLNNSVEVITGRSPRKAQQKHSCICRPRVLLVHIQNRRWHGTDIHVDPRFHHGMANNLRGWTRRTASSRIGSAT